MYNINHPTFSDLERNSPKISNNNMEKAEVNTIGINSDVTTMVAHSQYDSLLQGRLNVLKKSKKRHLEEEEEGIVGVASGQVCVYMYVSISI